MGNPNYNALDLVDGKHFDLIFIDLVMNKPFSSDHIIRAIRTFGRNTTVKE